MRQRWVGWVRAQEPSGADLFLRPEAVWSLGYATGISFALLYCAPFSVTCGVEYFTPYIALLGAAIAARPRSKSAPRAQVARGVFVAMFAALLALAQAASLRGHVFDSVMGASDMARYGEGTMSFFCGGVLLAPVLVSAAWIALRRRRPVVSGLVAPLAHASIVALALLVAAALARHARAPSADAWLRHMPETLHFASPWADASAWREIEPPHDSHGVARRPRFERTVLGDATLWVERSTLSPNGCEYGLFAPDQGRDIWFRHGADDCRREVVLEHDPVAGLLRTPRSRYEHGGVYDYRLRRWEHGDLRRVRRSLGPPSTWVVCSALGLALALWSLARARRRVIALDPREWREGLIDVDGAVNVDGMRVRADFAPRGEAGAVLVALESPPRGMAYRDGDAIVARAAIPGTWAEAHDALADLRDVDHARALAFACTGAAPLVGAWAAGLL